MQRGNEVKRKSVAKEKVSSVAGSKPRNGAINGSIVKRIYVHARAQIYYYLYRAHPLRMTSSHL